MRIAFVPRYGRHAASSRLRCFAIAEAMQRHEMAEVQLQTASAFTQVIVLQKVEGGMVATSAKCLQNAKRVYDLDDEGVEPREAIKRHCHAVTTDTECRAARIRSWFPGPVHVIPDPIDYEDGPPKAPNPEAHDGVVWFGNWPNFESIRERFEQYRSVGMRIGVISDLTAERANMPGLELIPWEYDTFPAELRKWSGVALSHDGADQCKSENKLVAAIYLGVMPQYVDGPAYISLMGKIRSMSIEEAQYYVYDNYRAEVIARRALEVYESL